MLNGCVGGAITSIIVKTATETRTVGVPYVAGEGDCLPKVTIQGFKCSACGHVWHSRKEEKPLRCARCRSPYWDRERISGVSDLQRGRVAETVDVAHVEGTAGWPATGLENQGTRERGGSNPLPSAENGKTAGMVTERLAKPLSGRKARGGSSPSSSAILCKHGSRPDLCKHTECRRAKP